MNSEYPTPDLLYRALGTTLRIAEAFPANKLDTRPAPQMMTVGEIIDHIAFNLEYVIEPIAAWLKRPDNTQAADKPRDRLARVNNRVREVLDAVPNTAWLTEITYPKGQSMSVVRAALVMLEHDAHHRGELIVVLRSLGIDPPERWPES